MGKQWESMGRGQTGKTLYWPTATTLLHNVIMRKTIWLYWQGKWVFRLFI